jgi:hypothetical protein
MVFWLTIALLPSCAYLSDRALDAHESVLVDAQLGVGVSADAKAGPLAAGVGWSLGAYSVGKSTWWSGLHSFGECSVGVPVLQGMGVVLSLNKPSPPVGIGLFATHFLHKSSVPGFARSSHQEEILSRPALLEFTVPPDRPMPNGVVDDFGIEAGAFLGIVGTRLGFNVAEFGDFILGWFGLDILGDDVRSGEKEQPEAEPPTEDPETTEERDSE